MKGTRWLLKSCPKCRGDLALVNELDGWEWLCNNCSRRFQPRPAPTPPSEAQQHHVIAGLPLSQ